MDEKGARKSVKGPSLLNPHARQLASPNGRKLREGWLLIAGYSRIRGVFVDKRYFVLWSHQLLSFFAAPPYNDRSVPIGTIALSKQTAVRPMRVRGQEWSFEIKLSLKSDKVMRIGAVDEAERDRWMRAIINCTTGFRRTPAKSRSGEISDTDSDDESVSRPSEDLDQSVSGILGGSESPVLLRVKDIDNNTWVELELDDELTAKDRRKYLEGKHPRGRQIFSRAKDERNEESKQTDFRGSSSILNVLAPLDLGESSPRKDKQAKSTPEKGSPMHCDNGEKGGEGKGDTKESSTLSPRETDLTPRSKPPITWEGILGKPLRPNLPASPASHSPQPSELSTPTRNASTPTSSSFDPVGTERQDSWSMSPRPVVPKPHGIVRSNIVTWEGPASTRSPPPPPLLRPNSPSSLKLASPTCPSTPETHLNKCTQATPVEEAVTKINTTPVTIAIKTSNVVTASPPPKTAGAANVSSGVNDTPALVATAASNPSTPSTSASTSASTPPPPPAAISSPAIPVAPDAIALVNPAAIATDTTIATTLATVSPTLPAKKKPAKPPHPPRNFTMPSPAKMAQMQAALPGSIEEPSPIKPRKPASTHKTEILRRLASSELAELGVYMSNDDESLRSDSSTRERSLGVAEARHNSPSSEDSSVPKSPSLNHSFSFEIANTPTRPLRPRRSPSPSSARGNSQRRSSSASPPRGGFRDHNQPHKVPASLLQTSASFVGTQTPKSKKNFPRLATLWGGIRARDSKVGGDGHSILEERDGGSLRDLLKFQHEEDDGDQPVMSLREMLRSKSDHMGLGRARSENADRESRSSVRSVKPDTDDRASISYERDGSSLRDQFQKSRAGIPQSDEEGEDTTPWTRDDIARERSMTLRGVYQLGQWILKNETAYAWDDGFDGYENDKERAARKPKRRAQQKRIGKEEFDESVPPTLSQNALDKINQARLRRKAGAEPVKTCVRAGWVLKAGIGPLMGKSYKRRFLMLWSTNELTWTRVQPYNNKSVLRGKVETIFLETEVGATTSTVGFTWELRLPEIRTYKFVAQTPDDREGWIVAIAARGVKRFDQLEPTRIMEEERRVLRSSVSCASPPVVSYVQFQEHSWEDGDVLPTFTRDRRNQLETPSAYMLSEVQENEEADEKEARSPLNLLRIRSSNGKGRTRAKSPEPLSPTFGPTSPTLKSFASSPPLRPFSPVSSSRAPFSLRTPPPKIAPMPPMPPLSLVEPPTSPTATGPSDPFLGEATPRALVPPKKPPRRRELLAAETDSQRLEAAVWVAEGAAAAAASAASIAATFEATALHALFSISFTIFRDRD